MNSGHAASPAIGEAVPAARFRTSYTLRPVAAQSTPPPAAIKRNKLPTPRSPVHGEVRRRSRATLRAVLPRSESESKYRFG